MKNSISKYNKYIYCLIGIIIIILLIELLHLSINFFPSIIDIIKSIFNILGDKTFYLGILSFILSILISIIISLIFCFIIFYVYTYFNNITYIISPIMAILKSVPVIILTLIIWLLLYNKLGSIIIGIIACVPIIYEGIMNGIESIDKTIINASKIDNCSKNRLYFKILLPLNKNVIITSILQSIGILVKVIITCEYIFQIKDSLGYMIRTSYDLIELGKLFAYGILLSIFIIIVEIIIKHLKKSLN